MLLRSSPTPILDSWFPSYNYSNNYSNSNSSPNNISERKPLLPRNNSISTFTTSSNTSSPTFPYNDHDHSKIPKCTPFEADLWDPPRSTMTSSQRMLSSVRLDEAEGGGGDDGCGVGHGGGGDGSGFNDYDSENSNNSEYGKMEAYYQKMIKANPLDPLFLGNYARFLKEVRGNVGKAEEYCERAILGSPRDANILSLYAEVLWQHRRDAERAQTYFHQAVLAAPNDCYVHASYAKFLWEAEEDDEAIDRKDQDNPSLSPPLQFLEETSQRFLYSYYLYE